jgi:hypothetical protein
MGESGFKSHSHLASMILMKMARLGVFTPKAFANCSPGLPQPWDQILNKQLNSERVCELVWPTFANTFGVTSFDAF